MYRCRKARYSGSDPLAALNDSDLSQTVTSTAYFHVERRGTMSRGLDKAMYYIVDDFSG